MLLLPPAPRRSVRLSFGDWLPRRLIQLRNPDSVPGPRILLPNAATITSSALLTDINKATTTADPLQASSTGKQPRMDDLNALEPPSATWFERNRPPPRPQDVIHAEAVMNMITDIDEEVVYIHQQIDDVLRDPNLDMLRQAASRIAFALRQLKWNFEHFTTLHDQIKVKVDTIEARLEVLERGADVGTGPSTGVAFGSDSGAAGGTNAGTDAGPATVAESATESSTDADIDTPSTSDSSSSNSNSPTLYGTPTGGSPIGYHATLTGRQDSPTNRSDSDTPAYMHPDHYGTDPNAF